MSSYIQNNHIAKHYAAISYELAKESGVVAATHGELEALVALQKSDAAFADFCSNPTIGRDKKLEVVAQISSGLMGNLLRALAQNNRLPLLGLIAKFFVEIERKDKGEITVQVTSAGELSQAQQNSIKQSITAAFNAPIILELQQDASLIAGLKIKYGSHELDASAQGRLRVAEERLNKVIEQAK